MLDLTHEQLVALSWVIGMANPASAWLVGPFLAWLLRRRSAGTRRRAAIAGWLLLGVAQAAFLAFGFGSGFLGFRYAQPIMIPISLLNFVAVYWLAKRATGQPAAIKPLADPLSEEKVREATAAAYRRWMGQAGLEAKPWEEFAVDHPREAQQWVEAMRAGLSVAHLTPPATDPVGLGYAWMAHVRDTAGAAR